MGQFDKFDKSASARVSVPSSFRRRQRVRPKAGPMASSAAIRNEEIQRKSMWSELGFASQRARNDSEAFSINLLDRRFFAPSAGAAPRLSAPRLCKKPPRRGKPVAGYRGP